jgi:predicted NAD/FAD-dependent oxidoreductase
MANTPIRSAVVLGAGIAGLACAIALAEAGIAVTLIDKGRRPGGRVATRRSDGTAFNHGAQYVTARDPAFTALLAQLRTANQAAPWLAADPKGGRIVFLPGMSALPAAMAKQAAALGVTVLTERHAAFLHAAESGWSVRHLPAADIRPGATTASGGEVAGPYDAVLLAVPSDQAAPLLATASHPFAQEARRAVIAPCWAVMARFADPVPGPDVLHPDNSPMAWAAREGSRPGRVTPPEAWTLHASADWSRAHLEDSPAQAGSVLIAAFQTLTGAGEPDLVHAHRWRHALVETPLGVRSLWDPATRVGACGDWCLGGRVEAAYDSGLALAAAVTGLLQGA